MQKKTKKKHPFSVSEMKSQYHNIVLSSEKKVLDFVAGLHEDSLAGDWPFKL